MIKIIAKNFVNEDRIEDFIALAKELGKRTRELDEGCLKYELYQDTRRLNIITFLEEWENQELLDRHMSSAHFKNALPAFELFVEKTEVNRYKIVE